MSALVAAWTSDATMRWPGLPLSVVESARGRARYIAL